jgi:alpha-tubulin suppressor-like RCC1 family protein
MSRGGTSPEAGSGGEPTPPAGGNGGIGATGNGGAADGGMGDGDTGDGGAGDGGAGDGGFGADHVSSQTFKSVAAGWRTSCGIRSDDTVACWGTPPMMGAPPAGPFASVAVSDGACGLRADGSLECWGTGSERPSTSKFRSISLGAGYHCGITLEGSLDCWGDNNEGRDPPTDGPYRVVSMTHIGCLLRTDGTLTCWSWDSNPIGRAPPPGEFEAISVGGGHACGLRPGGELVCWGDRVPAGQPLGGTFREVAAGRSGNRSDELSFSCALRSTGELVCWGDADAAKSAPATGSFRSVSAGWHHACAVRDDSRVVCWGSDEYGQVTPP